MKTKLKFVVIIFAVFVLLGGCFYVHKCYSDYSETHELLLAIECEDVDNVEQLLLNGIDPNRTDIPPNKLWSFFEITPKRPLALACRIGNLEIVKLLISYGATAEFIPGTGFSPLRETLFYYQPNDLQIVYLLLENGAKAEDESEGNLTFVAAQMAPRIYDSTKANGTVFATGYDEATAKGITEIVCSLLDDQSINITNKAGKSLLILSVQAENLHLAEYLVDQGCDLSVIDASGKTAQDYASELNSTAMIAILEARN